jgi:hypothetical protein
MPSGEALWIEKFDKRQTPQGRDYVAGEFVNQDKGEDTDEWALGYISVVPVQFIWHIMPHKNSTLGNGMNKTALLKGFLLGIMASALGALFL